MSTHFDIRPAEPGDAEQIAFVNHEAWLSTYHGILEDSFLEARSLDEQVALWQETLAQPNPSSQRYVALSGGKIVGYCGGGRNPDTRSPFQSELFGIYVLKQHQGQGLGRQLTTVLANWLLVQGHQSMLVWIMEKNPYRRFYTSIGGELLDQTRDVDYGGRIITVVSYGWTNLQGLAGIETP